jgi:uncharacterized protein (TIGR00255 family)
MLKSMTGYAFTDRTDGQVTVSAEIRSYNSRYLDVAPRLPMGYAGFEDKLKGLVSDAMERGRVELRIGIQDSSPAACAYQVDLQRAEAFCATANRLKDHLKLESGALSLEYLLNITGIIQPADSRADYDAHWPLIESVVCEALVMLNQMRLQEGNFIGKDLAQRLIFIEERLKEIESAVPDMVVQYRDKLIERVKALTQGVVEIDPTRLAQEAAIMADRSDISEEIVRARSHISQFRHIMASDEPGGRKLNFLLQEFNREFNTMGAKIGQAAHAHIIVAIKSEIEKLREQVQNIE